MERNDLDIVSINNEEKLYDGIKQALICGFFTQVAYKEGVKGLCITAKDSQVWSAEQSYF
jgi:pre-mRNA-splicing factor ATP-dependent RNA helicase DHX15/PRP43